MKTLTSMTLALLLIGCAGSKKPTLTELQTQLEEMKKGNELLRQRNQLLAERAISAEKVRNELQRQQGIAPAQNATDVAPAIVPVPPAPIQNPMGGLILANASAQMWYPSPGEMLELPTVMTAAIDEYPRGWSKAGDEHRMEIKVTTGNYHVGIRSGARYIAFSNWAVPAVFTDKQGFRHAATALPPGHMFTVRLVLSVSVREGASFEFVNADRVPFRGDHPIKCTKSETYRDPFGGPTVRSYFADTDCHY